MLTKVVWCLSGGNSLSTPRGKPYLLARGWWELLVLSARHVLVIERGTELEIASLRIPAAALSCCSELCQGISLPVQLATGVFAAKTNNGHTCSIFTSLKQFYIHCTPCNSKLQLEPPFRSWSFLRYDIEPNLAINQHRLLSLLMDMA